MDYEVRGTQADERLVQLFPLFGLCFVLVWLLPPHALAFIDGDIGAIVGDAPMPENYDHINPGLNLNVIGQKAHPERHGLALSLGSELAQSHDVELLGLKEDGTINAVNINYFGSDW